MSAKSLCFFSFVMIILCAVTFAYGQPEDVNYLILIVLTNLSASVFGGTIVVLLTE